MRNAAEAVTLEGFVKKLKGCVSCDEVLEALLEVMQEDHLLRFRFHFYVRPEDKLVSTAAVGYKKDSDYVNSFREGTFVRIEKSYPVKQSHAFWAIKSKKMTFIFPGSARVQNDFALSRRAKYLIFFSPNPVDREHEGRIAPQRLDIPLLVGRQPIGKISCDLPELEEPPEKAARTWFNRVSKRFGLFIDAAAPFLSSLSTRNLAYEDREKVLATVRQDVQKCKTFSELYDYLVNELRQKPPFKFPNASVFTFAPHPTIIEPNPDYRALVLRRTSFEKLKHKENLTGYLLQKHARIYYSSPLEAKLSKPAQGCALTAWVAATGRSLVLPDIRPSNKLIYSDYLAQIAGNDQPLDHTATIKDSEKPKSFLAVPLQDGNRVLGVLRFVGGGPDISAFHRDLLRDIIGLCIVPRMEALRNEHNRSIRDFIEKEERAAFAAHNAEGETEIDSPEKQISRVLNRLFDLVVPNNPQPCKMLVLVHRRSRLDPKYTRRIVSVERNIEPGLQLENRSILFDEALSSKAMRENRDWVVLPPSEVEFAEAFSSYNNLLETLGNAGFHPKTTIIVPVRDDREKESDGVLLYLSEAYDDECRGALSLLAESASFTGSVFAHSLSKAPALVGARAIRHDFRYLFGYIQRMLDFEPEERINHERQMGVTVGSVVGTLQTLFDFYVSILMLPTGVIQPKADRRRTKLVVERVCEFVRFYYYCTKKDYNKPLSLTLRVDPSVGEWLWFDPDVLQCVLLNLLRNAASLPYPQNKTTVNVSFAGDSSSGQLQIVIQDCGQIDRVEAIERKLNDEFFFMRGVSPIGNFGLRLVTKLLGDTGGKIDVKFNAGHVFTVHIPAKSG